MMVFILFILMHRNQFVKADCSTATITSSPLPNIDYPIQTGYQENLPQFSVDTPGCTVTYSLTQSDGTPYPTLVSFYYLTRQFNIWATATGLSSSLRYTGTIDGTIISAYSDFNVNYQSNTYCVGATISPTTIPVSYSYIIGDPIMIIANLDWTSSKCNIIYNFYNTNYPVGLDTIFYRLGNQLVLYTNNLAKAGSYLVIIRGNIGGLNVDISTLVTISVPCSTCSCTIIMPATQSNQNYVIGTTSTFNIVPFTESVGGCGPFTYSITGVAFVTVSGTVATVYTTDGTLDGTSQNIAVHGTLPNGQVGSTNFMLILSASGIDPCAGATITTTPNASPYYYAVRSPIMNLAPKDWTSSVSGCTITYSITDLTNISYTSIFYLGSTHVVVQTSNTLESGTYNVRLTGTVGVDTKSTTFNVVIGDCNTASITTSSVSNQQYQVGSPILDIVIPPFTTTLSNICPLSYQAISPPAFVIFNEALMKLSVYTTSILLAGTYSIRIQGVNASFFGIQMSFSLQIINPCLNAVISVSSQSSITYHIFYPTTTLTISKFTSDQSETLCGALVHTVTYSNGALLDSSIFSDTILPSSIDIQIQTNDELKVGVNLLKIFATHSNPGSGSGFFTFFVTIDNPCSTAPITLPSITTQNYKTFDPILTFSHASFVSGDQNCGTFSYSLLSNPLPAILTYNNIFLQFQIYTEDSSYGGDYNLYVQGTLSNGGSSAILIIPLTVSFACPIAKIKIPSLDVIEYYVGNEKKVVNIPYFTDHTNDCNKLYYTFLNPDSSIFKLVE